MDKECNVIFSDVHLVYSGQKNSDDKLFQMPFFSVSTAINGGFSVSVGFYSTIKPVLSCTLDRCTIYFIH